MVPLFTKSGEETKSVAKEGNRQNEEIRSISPKVFGSAFYKKRRRKKKPVAKNRLSVECRNTQYFAKVFGSAFYKKRRRKQSLSPKKKVPLFTKSGEEDKF
ncbi:MAG: hypothetical protein IIW26_03545 [Tidjanibacter sp.]|nr:hypothetical protein [Tidjanibacter sp.]MBQ6604794.1 hypothetical protein [Tidjanibacter sp.]